MVPRATAQKSPEDGPACAWPTTEPALGMASTTKRTGGASPAQDAPSTAPRRLGPLDPINFPRLFCLYRS